MVTKKVYCFVQNTTGDRSFIYRSTIFYKNYTARRKKLYAIIQELTQYKCQRDDT